jgi:hypothetical protein
MDAVGNEEVIDGDGARARARSNLDLGAEDHEHRRRVRRMGGDAAFALRNDVTMNAILLEAEAQRLAPEVRLVVIRAARVETQVAAQRAHVTELRTGDQRRGTRQRGEVTQHDRVARQPAQGDERPEVQSILILADEVQLLHLPDVNT